MAATFIILGLSIGGLGLIVILLCCNVILHGCRLHFYIKKTYPVKFNSYKKKLDPFEPTKKTNFLDSNDLTFRRITNMLEKRIKIYLYLFSICILSIVLLTASGLILHAFNKFD